MFYMLATILPLYVQVGLHGDEQQMGLVITIYVLGSVFARLFSGFLVDRFGNKKWVLLDLPFSLSLLLVTLE